MGLTNNTGKLSNTITSNGSSVSIGGSTMSSIFNINGTDPLISFQNAGSTKWQVGLENTASNRFIWYDNTAAAYRMVINSSGNVGIGTSSPYSKLGVGSSTSANGEIGLVPDFEGAGEHALISYLSGTGYKNLNIEAGQIRFWTGTSSTTERMRITSGGAVGINTGSATLNSTIPLNIQASSGGNAIFMRGNASHQSSLVFAQNASDTSYTYIIAQGNSTGNMQFCTGDTERMRITSGGVICMNTTTAAGTLSLKAQSDNRAIFFQNPNGGDGSIWLYGASNSFDYKFSTWSQGSAFYLYNNGNYSFAGSNVSDRRLKQNIQSITYNAIEKIMQLVPKSYNMIAQPETIRNGFIAQEVKEVLPDVITGTETDEEYLGLDYNGLLAIAIKAIQELSAKVTALENR